MTYISSLLNRITMYRLALLVLLGYIIIAVIESFCGILPFNPLDIALQVLYLVIVSALLNRMFSKIFNAVINKESATITALILSLIVGPVDFSRHIVLLTLLALLATASKYILAIKKRHVFNPAALAVTLAAILGWFGASWWVGNLPLIFFTTLGGFLILAKVKRFTLVATFLVVYLIALAFSGLDVVSLLIYSPIVFFATVMLIEPLTSPVETNKQMAYAVFVAIALISFQQYLGVGYTLELALLAGNVFFYMISSPFRTTLTLKAKKKLAESTFAFYFEKDIHFDFKPGQFMHWTLPQRNSDAKGVRRYFTIASSPTEEYIMIATKIPEKDTSSFKKTLENFNNGDKIVAMDAAGEFLLPNDKSIPLTFVAGGIGITPFASMAKYLLDKKESRDIHVLYSNSRQEDIAFKDLFDEAEKVGIKTDYIITEKEGYLDEKKIKERVQDWEKRIYYISGPQPMVEIFKKMLLTMKVRGIKTDFFPGYPETHQKK